MQTAIPRRITSIDLMTKELLQRGYKKAGEGFPARFEKFMLPSGRSWITPRGLLAYPFVPVTVQKIALSKLISQEFASYVGLPVPATLVLPRQATELDDFLDTHKVVVVKPLDSYGSHGLTIDVRDRNLLTSAISNAQKYSDTTLVQRQVDGQEVRLTVMDRTVVSCLLRETPRVVGDGVASIAQLIRSENELRRRYSDGLMPYPLLDESLIASSWLREERVPLVGEVVELNRSTLLAGGATILNVSNQVHDSYKRAAVRLATELQADFIAVDIMVVDFRQPADDKNYVFLECNTAPSLRMYYGRRGEADYDIVPRLADMIDTYLNNTNIGKGHE